MGLRGGREYLFPTRIPSGVVQGQTSHTHTRTHPHPGHCGAKQVFARLIPACEEKVMYYLSDCWVLYVRKEAAICALEALCCGGSQANKLTHLQRRRRSQRCDSCPACVCSVPSYLPSFPACLVGPLGSAHWDILMEGAVCMRAGTVGWEGPSGQVCVPFY